MTATAQVSALQTLLGIPATGRPDAAFHSAFETLCLAAAHEQETQSTMNAPLVFSACKAGVLNRGIPPDSFLRELVAWAKTAPDEIFAPNDEPRDIYASVATTLGNLAAPRWNGLAHRKAAMLEVLRVLAGFESSWDWSEGVDTTNAHSLAHREGEETGIFQVSADSMDSDPSLRRCVEDHCGAADVATFIADMKTNHDLAIEYCARLLRFSITWDGPIKRREIHPYLSRLSVAEFQQFLTGLQSA